MPSPNTQRALIVGRGLAARDWADALRARGWAVENEPERDALHHWFENAVMDLVVLDVATPDGQDAAPIAPMRAAWPGCRIIAIVSAHGFYGEDAHRLGVWQPDQVLVKPVPLGLLVSTAGLLAFQGATA